MMKYRFEAGHTRAGRFWLFGIEGPYRARRLASCAIRDIPEAAFLHRFAKNLKDTSRTSENEFYVADAGDWPDGLCLQTRANIAAALEKIGFERKSAA